MAFFCSCTCVKVLFTDTFLESQLCWKVEIISTFSLARNVPFFLNKLFLSIHLNKVSYYNMTVCSYHVTYEFQSGSTLCARNSSKLLAQNRRKIFRLSDCNGTRTHNHLIRKRTLNHLAKLAKGLSSVLYIWLYVLIMSRTSFRVNP